MIFNFCLFLGFLNGIVSIEMIDIVPWEMRMLRTDFWRKSTLDLIVEKHSGILARVIPAVAWIYFCHHKLLSRACGINDVSFDPMRLHHRLMLVLYLHAECVLEILCAVLVLPLIVKDYFMG